MVRGYIYDLVPSGIRLVVECYLYCLISTILIIDCYPKDFVISLIKLVYVDFHCANNKVLVYMGFKILCETLLSNVIGICSNVIAIRE